MKNKECPFRDNMKVGMSLELRELEEFLKPTQGEIEYERRQREKKDRKGDARIQGKLHSGSKKGPVVSNPKQGIAIALSEARKAGAKIKKPKK